ncbi:MAG: T9SS type A sorting domain-containing protein [Bacteroidota bacterium]
MKNKVFLYFLFLLISNLKAQTNLIPNGGFETGGPPSCTYTWYEHYHIDNWIFNIGNYDWFDIDWMNQNCQNDLHLLNDYYTNNPPSKRFVGIIGQIASTYVYDPSASPHYSTSKNKNESIEVKLDQKLKARGGYFLKLKTCLAPYQGHTTVDNDIILNIIFSNNLDFESCSSINYTETLKLDKYILRDWQEKSIYFRLPKNKDNIFEYLTIQGKNDNVDSYIMIDDVELYNSCNDPCTPEGAYAPLIWTDGNPPEHFNACFINDCVPNHTNCLGVFPWHFAVTNATEIDFCVNSRWIANDCIFHDYIYDDNILNNNVVDPTRELLYVWNGYKQDNQKLPDNVYDYTISVRNCVTENDYFYVGKITVVNTDNLPPQLYYLPSFILNEDCCKDNFELNSYSTIHPYYQVSDYIIANDNYIIPSDGNITFDAGQMIQLGAGFQATHGCSFLAKINGCAIEKSKTIVSNPNDLQTDIFQKNSSLSEFTVTPNPFHDNLNITIKPKEEQQLIHLSIVNIYGHELKILYEGEINNYFSNVFTLGNEIKSGIYFIVYRTNNQSVKYYKVIKL